MMLYGHIKDKIKRGRIIWIDYSHGLMGVDDYHGTFFAASWSGILKAEEGDWATFKRDGHHPDTPYRFNRRYRKAAWSKDKTVIITDWAGNELFRGDYDDPECDRIIAINKYIDENGEERGDEIGVAWEDEAGHEGQNVYEYINY